MTLQDIPTKSDFIHLGTNTPWGRIASIIFRYQDGEVYYMMIDNHGGVTLMPQSVVEQAVLGERTK